jgi:hypothetical protein
MANPYAQAASIAAPFTGIGNQIMQGANAYEMGKNKMQSEMAKQFAMQAHADMYGAQAGKAREEAMGLEQARMNRSPQGIQKMASVFAGLNDPQAREMQAFQSNGNWGVDKGYSLPADQEGPVTPDVQKSAPQWYSPQVQSKYNAANLAGMLNASATGKTDANKLLETILLGEAAGKGGQAVNGIQAALKGQMYDFKEFGTGDASTGKIAFNQPYLQKNTSEVGKNNAAAANSYASAGEHKAGAALKNSKIGQPTVNPDGSVTAPAVPPKPMPAAALKMQQEGLENLSIASNINPMMQRFVDDIDSNKLRLGPVANLMNKGKNFAGSSDEGSRNFASFQATLEKLRNDSLRLNKGVQTDGDAQRAWNELMSNINDPGVVKQRIKEIQDINEKAVELQRMNINQVRRNYGNSDIDVSGYVAKPTSATSKETQPQYTRTGTFNGRKVGMLPNGQTVYQDTGEVAK